MDDRIDRLIALDFGGRGVTPLAEAACALAGGSAVWAAARRLADMPRGAVVIVTTGCAVRPWIDPRIAENDGPLGAALVAALLANALDAVPLLLAEEALLPPLSGMLAAAGLTRVEPDAIPTVTGSARRLSAFAARAYPMDDAGGRAAAGRLLDDHKPALLFAAERIGRNARGVYHNARGADVSAGTARIDLLFEEAARRGLPTIGVGDGGNEIGMGGVAEQVRAHVPFGGVCACDCGGGLAAVTAVDVLLCAACSNWGCIALAACAAVLLGRPELIPTAAEVERLHRQSVALGLLNSPAGRVDPHVDGIPLESHLAVTALIGELARQGSPSYNLPAR